VKPRQNLKGFSRFGLGKFAIFPDSAYNEPMLTKRVKSRIISEHGAHEKDTGSAGVQVAVISRQIDELAAHLKKHAKDNHSRRGLLKMVSQRRKLLTYLKRREPAAYEKTLKKLGLKK